MLFALFYVVAIVILVLHFTGFLARHNLEWLVLVLAVAVFPAVIYLENLKNSCQSTLNGPQGPFFRQLLEAQTRSTINCLIAATSGAITTTCCGKFSMPAMSAGRTGSVPSASRMVSSNLAG